jgi:signal-transduction protein with cAMP-binding, CBS, and nucleotidyltransferase domain
MAHAKETLKKRMNRFSEIKKPRITRMDELLRPARKTSRQIDRDQIKKSTSHGYFADSMVGLRQSEAMSKLIAEQPFFDGLGPRQVKLLSRFAMEVNFEAGQWIFEKGSPANRFHLILQGKAVVESYSPEQGTVPMQTLGPGDSLGWSWLFPPYQFVFSARALEPTKTIFFYATWLRQQCAQNRTLGYELTKRIAAVVINNLKAVEQHIANRSSMRAR